jgi:hypothetical protein
MAHIFLYMNKFHNVLDFNKELKKPLSRPGEPLKLQDIGTPRISIQPAYKTAKVVRSAHQLTLRPRT